MAGQANLPFVMEMLIACADEGREAATNREMADALGLASVGNISGVVKLAEQMGFIKVQRFQTRRIVTIVASGKSTAAPKWQTPHWRERAGA